MNFFPCLADPDVWMRKMVDHYEYIGTYVDDLEIASKDPSAIVDTLRHVYNFTLKVAGPIEFHLGCDFWRDNEGILCFAPRRYIEQVIDSFERTFGHKPKQYTSPLEKNDHPELDTSDELGYEGIAQYQSLIGQLQWTVSLG